MNCLSRFFCPLELIFFVFNDIYLFCLFVCLSICMPQCICGDQRTTCKGLIFLSTEFWDGSRIIVLVWQAHWIIWFYSLSHLIFSNPVLFLRLPFWYEGSFCSVHSTEVILSIIFPGMFPPCRSNFSLNDVDVASNCLDPYLLDMIACWKPALLLLWANTPNSQIRMPLWLKL